MTPDEALDLVPAVRGMRAAEVRADCALLIVELARDRLDADRIVHRIREEISSRRGWPGVDEMRAALTGQTPTVGDFYLQQIRRLRNLHFYPRDTEAQELLADTLREAAPANEKLARKIIAEIRANSRECPTPFDILSWAKLLAEPGETRACTRCKGTGFIMHTPEGKTAAGAMPCPGCRKPQPQEMEAS